MGWATAAELAEPRRLTTALTLCGEALSTDRPDIQGQRLVEVVAWLLALPIATALIDDAPVPAIAGARLDLDRSEVELRGEPMTELPAAALERELAPLIGAVNAATGRPRAALTRATADRYDGAIAWIADTTGRRDRAFELLDQRDAELRLLDLGTHSTLLHVRKGCCLYYRTPASLKCFGCPLLDDAARRRLVTAGGA
jgi:hypothetical protein